MIHATQIGSIELQVHDLGGLVGQRIVGLDLKIINPQHETFEIEAVTLKTNGEEYAAKRSKSSRCCGDPDDLTRQYFFWEFDRPIYKVFGKTGELDLATREAQSHRVLTIKLEQ